MKEIGNNHSFPHILLDWHHKKNKRSMPWKMEKDPYKIWLSEIILQQTRVEQGTAYYLRFVNNYPTINHLADAAPGEVFKLWEGLGYYSRCKNLIEAAKYIAGDLNGIFPDSYEEILKLKGIGPYTAAAIASFAFNAPYAVVDGNVNRVLARFYGIITPIDTTQGKVEMTNLANKLLPPGKSALYNQAIMDFGATVCKPKLPLCETCIFTKLCVAVNNGKVQQLPVKQKSLVKKNRWFYFIILKNGNKFFIQQRMAKDIWQNLYQFLLIEKDAAYEVADILSSTEMTIFPEKKTKILSASPTFKQQLTHQTIHARFILLELEKKTTSFPGKWVTKKQMNLLPFPGIINEYMSKSAVEKNELE